MRTKRHGGTFLTYSASETRYIKVRIGLPTETGLGSRVERSGSISLFKTTHVWSYKFWSCISGPVYCGPNPSGSMDWVTTVPANLRCWLHGPWTGGRNIGGAPGKIHYDINRTLTCPSKPTCMELPGIRI